MVKKLIYIKGVDFKDYSLKVLLVDGKIPCIEGDVREFAETIVNLHGKWVRPKLINFLDEGYVCYEIMIPYDTEVKGEWVDVHNAHLTEIESRGFNEQY